MTFPIRPEDRAVDHVKERIASLFLFNEVRIMELLESIQFGLGYLFVGFLAGVALDYSFPKFDEETKTKDLFFQVLYQCICMIIVVFYVRKIVKVMPFMFVLGIDINRNGKVDSFRPYEASEYGGEIMIALMIVGSQFNLIKKIDLLSRRLYRWYYNEEKSIGLSLGI